MSIIVSLFPTIYTVNVVSLLLETLSMEAKSYIKKEYVLQTFFSCLVSAQCFMPLAR